jgi:hypothetical protein
MAKARAKISRPQPNSLLMGFRNKPKLVLSPKVRRTTIEPQSKTTVGVRQELVFMRLIFF